MRKTKIKLSIIDIDGMFYHSCRDTSLEESIQVFKEKLENCLIKTEATHWVGFYTNKQTFRKLLFSGYKSNRTQNPPKYLRSLKEWAIAEYNLQQMDNVEADDLVAYWCKEPIIWGWINTLTMECGFTHKIFPVGHKDTQVVEKIVCSPDKDLLQSIPGKHFNYSYKLDYKNKDTLEMEPIKGWWIDTSIENSTVFQAKQLLMGDSADGISCLERIGDKRADKILDSWEEGSIESYLLNYYIEFYKSSSKGIYEFQKNYRLLHMLDCDEDFIREIGKLPEFPKIIEIKQEVKPIDTELPVF